MLRPGQDPPIRRGESYLTLGAVVTHFDSWPLAARCLEALRAWGGPLERILVIDDHSSTPPGPLPSDARITLQINAARRGFAASLNRGVTKMETDVVVVFDADAYPLADASEAILRAFASEPHLGLLGFRTVDARGRDTPAWSAPPSSFALVAGQRLDGWLHRVLPLYRPKEVCLHTAALAVRRGAFFAVGGADEELGFLDVDIDLSMRMRRAGWIVRWDPTLVAYHEGGGTPVTTRWRVEEFHRSRYRLLRKHGLIRSPAFVRVAVLARLTLESLLLKALGGLLFPDADRHRDKIVSRRALIRLARREFR